MPSPKHIALFFLGALILTSWHSDSGHNDNSTSRAAMVAAVVRHGTVSIDAYHRHTGDKALITGHYYSDKAPLPTLLVTPVWWIADRTGLAQTRSHCMPDALLQVGGFLCGSVPLALLMVLLWMRLRRSNAHWSALLAVVPLLGSFLFVYSSSFYNHLLAALFAVLAATALERQRPLEAGLHAGAAIACESALLFFALTWGLQLARRPREAMRFLAGTLPAALIILWYNAATTGHPFEFPNAHALNYGAMHRNYGFGTWQPEAFWGLTFSPYRGAFFFAPALFLALPILVMHRRSVVSTSWFRDPFLVPAIVLVLAFFTHATWWGGWAYGPRYLTAAVVLVLFQLVPMVAASRALVPAMLALSFVGLLCAAAAKSTVWYALPTGERDPLSTEVVPRLLNGAFTDMQWPVELGVTPLMATLLFAIVTAATIFALHRLDRST